MAKEKVNTESLFKSMIGDTNNSHETPAAPVVAEVVAVPVAAEPQHTEPVKSGRKARPEDEQTIQVSFYPTKAQAKELKMQVAEGGKESDKSALARTAFDIVLTLSDEEYREMKATAEMRGVTPGQIVKEALQMYFSQR